MNVNNTCDSFIIDQRNRWDRIHSKYRDIKKTYDTDLWLVKHKIYLEKSRDVNVIDLGCGSGHDSFFLSQNGYNVIACDFSEEALCNIRNNIPQVKTKNVNILETLPFKTNSIRVVVADLSLHYFSKKDTNKILREISRVLIPKGILLCRVNSDKDINFNFGQGIELEENYYEIPEIGRKRFFNENQIKDFFRDWDILYLQENIISRYGKEKSLYEVVVENNKDL